MRNAELDNLIAEYRVLSCGEDHSRIRHGDPQNGNDFGKIMIAYKVGVAVQADIFGFAKTGDRDRVGTAAEDLLQMPGVQQHGDRLVFIIIQAVQDADANIVDSALHCAVHGGRMPVIIALGSLWMIIAVGGAVIGFLE
ncbi:hypothetical protein D3C71_1475280 [compost metagenome]